MIRLLPAIACLLWPFAALSAPLAVQSGEHADFSRVVVTLKPGPDWRLGRVDGGYELRPDAPNDGYDLRKVFDLIPRDRIAALEPRAGGHLFFRVDCDCHADAFEIRSGLVIDIKDGPPPRANRFEVALEALEQPARPRPVSRPGTVAGPAIAPAEKPAIPLTTRFPARRTEYAWADALAMDLSRPRAAAAPMAAPAEPETAAPPRDRVLEVQQQLIEQLGRAAVQGLVTADLSQTEARIEKTRPMPDIDGQGAPTHHPPLPPEPDAVGDPVRSDHIRFETAVDRGRNALRSTPLTSDGTKCLPGDDFDIATWGAAPDKGGSLSLSHAAVVAEFDEADPKGIETVAKQYIYLTFGAEAKALMTVFDVAPRNAQLLHAMADIMDTGSTEANAIPRDQLACDDRVAMWAILAAPSLSKGEDIAENAVLSAFGELPLHLRRHLGPILAERLLGIGDSDTATAIRNSIGRAPGDHGPGFVMLDARIALETGHAESGTDQLADIIRQDGPLAPDAVIRLIDTQLDADQPLPAGMAETAAAMAFEARGTPQGSELARVHIRAQAHGGEFLAALKNADQTVAAGDLPDTAATEIRQEVFTLLAAKASDEEFLQAVLPTPMQIGADDAAQAIRRDIAARLIDLDLPKPARDILAAGVPLPGPQDRQLFAKAYLKERRADLAMGYLAGLSDAESRGLRAKTHALAGEHARAASEFERLGDKDARARSSWRGGDWQTVAEIGAPAEMAAAGLVSDPPTPDPDLGPLATNRKLLERSQETRQLLANLLTTTVKP
ncbi:MAG: hypothetical protein LJE68_11385 [Rhodobacter sp.]|nr:hypothetical protein [Rhodobacter sp.]